ncbi:hypothetical protein Hanom_Chr15g01391011 [Helianthus anomalus]
MMFIDSIWWVLFDLLMMFIDSICLWIWGFRFGGFIRFGGEAGVGGGGGVEVGGGGGGGGRIWGWRCGRRAKKRFVSVW